MSKIILSLGLAVTTLVIGVQSANAQSNIAVSGITNVNVDFNDFSAAAAGASSKAEATGALGSSVTATAGINLGVLPTATTTATGTTTGLSAVPNRITTSFINGNTAASGQVGIPSGVLVIGAGANANGNSQIKGPNAATASLQTTSKVGSFGNAVGGVADVMGSASDGINIASGQSNAGAAVSVDLTSGFISGSGSATSNLNTTGSPNAAGGTGAFFASPVGGGFFNVKGSATGTFTTSGFSFR